MSELFAVSPDLTKDEVVKAIFDLEHKNWEKARASQASLAEPALEGIKREMEPYSPMGAVVAYATKGSLTELPENASELNPHEAKNIGAVLLQVEKNSQGKHSDIVIGDYKLEPKEASAWLQANAVSQDGDILVKEWLDKTNVGLVAQGTAVKNGKEEILIETQSGQVRVVGNGDLSEPLKGNYGTISIGGDESVGVYITDKIYNDMKAGNAYNGPVFVMQQMDGGKADEPKVGYAANVDEFRAVMASAWKDAPEFKKNLEGQYAEMSREQFELFKTDLKAKPDLSLDEFIKAHPAELKGAERKPIAALVPDDMSAVAGMITSGDDRYLVAPAAPASSARSVA